VHAHLCGDGSIWREFRKRTPRDLATHKRKKIFREFWMLNFTNTCKFLLNEFESDMLKAFGRKLAHISNGTDLRANSVKKILSRLKLLGKNSHNWFIPYEVLNASKDVRVNWLRAFFDDEGTVEKSRLRIRIKSVNLKGLEQVKAMLEELGICCTLTGPNCDKTWFLSISGKNVLKFAEIVSFNHPLKKEKLMKSILA
jgi:intein/homing endonuclease